MAAERSQFEDRVYSSDEADAAVSGLQRALHRALCRAGRGGLHSGSRAPMCLRAMLVAEKWFDDMKAQ